MRILHIFPTFAFGGQQRRFAQIVNSQLGGEPHYHVIVSLNGDLDAITLVSDNRLCEVRDWGEDTKKLSVFSEVKCLRAMIISEKPTLLCTYNWGSLDAVIANKISLRVRHIHYEDGFGEDETLERQKSRRVLARRVLLRDSKIVVPSRGLEKLAADAWRLPREQILRIPNGVDTQRFHPSRERASSDAVTIGTVAALRAEKNQAALLQAAAAPQLSRLSQIEIIGEGPEKRNLATLCQNLDLDAEAVLLGGTEHPEEAYKKFDIFALPSLTEQMPLSVLEAMACGLPVAASDVGDIADMVCAENRQFITPAGDQDAFEASLIALAQDAALRQRIGAANEKRARDIYSLEKMVEAHQALFTSMAAGAA